MPYLDADYVSLDAANQHPACRSPVPPAGVTMQLDALNEKHGRLPPMSGVLDGDVAGWLCSGRSLLAVDDRLNVRGVCSSLCWLLSLHWRYQHLPSTVPSAIIITSSTQRAEWLCKILCEVFMPLYPTLWAEHCAVDGTSSGLDTFRAKLKKSAARVVVGTAPALYRALLGADELMDCGAWKPAFDTSGVCHVWLDEMDVLCMEQRPVLEAVLRCVRLPLATQQQIREQQEAVLFRSPRAVAVTTEFKDVSIHADTSLKHIEHLQLIVTGSAFQEPFNDWLNEQETLSQGAVCIWSWQQQHKLYLQSLPSCTPLRALCARVVLGQCSSADSPVECCIVRVHAQSAVQFAVRLVDWPSKHRPVQTEWSLCLAGVQPCDADDLWHSDAVRFVHKQFADPKTECRTRLVLDGVDDQGQLLAARLVHYKRVNNKWTVVCELPRALRQMGWAQTPGQHKTLNWANAHPNALTRLSASLPPVEHKEDVSTDSEGETEISLGLDAEGEDEELPIGPHCPSAAINKISPFYAGVPDDYEEDLMLRQCTSTPLPNNKTVGKETTV